MNRITFILLLALLVGCTAPTEVSFFVAGSCQECEPLIKDAVESVEGAEFSSWSVATSSVTVLFNGREEQLDAIQKAVSNAGFDTQYFPANAEMQAIIPDCCRKSNTTLSVPESEHSSGH